MRILLYTGKGGVGKTSVSAATALRCAERGYRTVVLSTDPAHSLGDAYDTPLGPTPKPIAPKLWAQEIDMYHELAERWGTIQGWLMQVARWRGVERIAAEEMTALPGMEEVSSLLQIVAHYDSHQYDVIVVDCAPTAETIRLLSFPEIASWWLDRIFPIQRKVAAVARPVIGRLTDLPMPSDAVFQQVAELFGVLDRMHNLLADPALSTMRIVVNPEKMVVKEAQRTFTYLNLFGYPTDLILCNRVLPDFAAGDSSSALARFWTGWREQQSAYLDLIESSFHPLPVLRAPYFEREVVGPAQLKRLADALYEDRDPTERFYRGHLQAINQVADGWEISLPLPFAERGAIDLRRAGDELVVTVGNFRRHLVLPRALATLPSDRAQFEGDTLKIHFTGSPGQKP